jgi:hypothetical protein
MDKEDIYVMAGSFCMVMGIILQVNTNTRYILFSVGGVFVVVSFSIMLKTNYRK